jgi:hypothetical protein
MLMDKKITGVFIAGLLVTILLFFVSIYLAGIAIILVLVLVMSLFILQDSRVLPDVEATLRDDAKAVIIRNTGNSVALKLHVALVPLNIEYDIPSLDADASQEYSLAAMVEEVKVVITFENEQQKAFSRVHTLSSSGEFDPLKPMFPLFRNK